MIYALKPVCKKDWKSKNGTSLIFIQYCRGANPEFNEDIKKVCRIAGIDESIKFS